MSNDVSVVAAVSLGQFVVFSRLIKRYVIRGYQIDADPQPPSPSPSLQNPKDQLIELETMDWLGRVRKRAIFVRDLHAYGPAELICKSTGERFVFCTHECLPLTSPLVNVFKS